jgi:hypothetical protein
MQLAPCCLHAIGYNRPQESVKSQAGEIMQKHTWRYLAVLAAVSAAAGCARQQASAPPPLKIRNMSKANVVAAAEDVLTRMHFAIEKADADAGYVKTRPLRGGQWFEFWRSDNASAYQGAQANVQSLQRTAEVNVSEIPGGVRVDCAVSVRRLSLPENDQVTMSRAAAMFTTSTGSLQRLEVNPDQAAGMEWIDLGPDGALAARILERIQKRIGSEG